MKLNKKARIVTLMVATVVLAVIFVPSYSANVNKTKSEKALEYVSQKHGIPKEWLIITNEKEANFYLSNQKIWSINILDPKAKEFYYVDLDEAGDIADAKAAKALEYAKYKEKYGKKEIALHEKLQKMNPDDTVEVGIWLSPIADAAFPEREINDQEYKDILDAKRKAYAQKEKPVLDILKAKNINIRYASQYAPLIYAEVPAKLIAEVENISEVDGVYLAREFKPMLDNVASTYRVQGVWNAGINGNGIKVALIEEGLINFSNSYLLQGTNNTSALFPSNHATEVAGIVASQHPTYKGISYGVPGLLSANYGYDNIGMESRVIAASEWAINNNANILSNSWGNETNGTMSGIDKYFDHIILENRKTVTVAAGNEGQTTGNVQSPGLGYNVITVGGFEDQGDSIWSNDMMWVKSSYIDPRSRNGDREKPEVAAIATHISESSKIITTKGNGTPPVGQTAFAGTSYAAPAVAAEAALLMQANSSLTNHPETVKAIIMASAVHNIEGDSRLSEYDGAGGIDILSAYDKTEYSSTTVSSGGEFPKHFTFSAAAGQRVRTVIAWDSHPDNNSPPNNDDLKSDMNLVVYGPSGAQVAPPSNSFDNSYEIVEFTAPETGTYDAKVDIREFNGPEYLGFAKTALPPLSGWNYAKVKTINGTTAGAQTNYQMKLTVYNSTGTDTPGNVYFGGNAKSDFSDLRFTKSDGVTLLDYWIESYTSGVNATVWVEVDSIPASPNTVDIYLYYGNPEAISASNPEATVLLYDNFDDGVIDPNKWTNKGGVVVEENGYLRFGRGGQYSNEIRTKNTMGLNISIHAKVYRTTDETPNLEARSPSTRTQAYVGWWYGGYQRLAKNWVPLTQTALGLSAYTWHDAVLKVSGNASANMVWTIAGSTLSATDTAPLTGEYVAFTTWIDEGRLDNLFIRKYANPEPTWGV